MRQKPRQQSCSTAQRFQFSTVHEQVHRAPTSDEVPMMYATRRRPLTLALLAVVAASTFVLIVLRDTQPVAAQLLTLKIRPTHHFDATMGNPHHAYDSNESSAAGGAITKVCRTSCTVPGSLTATWDGFPGEPADYHPLRLEVKWRAYAGMALFGNDTAQITVSLEYDLGGGWTPWPGRATPGRMIRRRVGVAAA
jgi:hypothetical protein